MTKIAVIILNYNSSTDCRKCVSFLKRQESVELEIILVDNCSRKNDLIAVCQLAKEQGCTFIPVGENRGYNAGNNVGLRYADSKGYKYALIANPDMEFPQIDYITRMVTKMEENKEIVVVGSDIVNPKGNHQNPQREISYCEELFWFITLLRNRKSGKWFLCDYLFNSYCEKVSGCCLLLRMEFIKYIGYFDENIFLYGEESILAKQVKKANKYIYYLAEAKAVHFHLESEKGVLKPRMKALFRSRNYYLKTYSGYRGIKLRILLFSKFIQSLLY